MDLKELKDIDALSESYDRLIEDEDLSVEELKDIYENSRQLYWCLHDEIKMRSYSKNDYRGKFIRLNSFGSASNTYMYVTSQTISEKDPVEDSTLTLWGVYFNWEDGPYTDMADATFDASRSIEIRLETIKNYEKSEFPEIQEITEDEFKAQYKKMTEFVNGNVMEWVDCQRYEPDNEKRKIKK